MRLTALAVMRFRGSNKSSLLSRSIPSSGAAVNKPRKSCLGTFLNSTYSASFVCPCSPSSASSNSLEKGLGTHWPVLLRRRPERAEDGVELLKITLAGHVRHAKHELCKDAPRGPVVDAGAVRASAEEELGGSVPSAPTA